jgi:hypothetical protein
MSFISNLRRTKMSSAQKGVPFLLVSLPGSGRNQKKHPGCWWWVHQSAGPFKVHLNPFPHLLSSWVSMPNHHLAIVRRLVPKVENRELGQELYVLTPPIREYPGPTTAAGGCWYLCLGHGDAGPTPGRHPVYKPGGIITAPASPAFTRERVVCLGNNSLLPSTRENFINVRFDAP